MSENQDIIPEKIKALISANQLEEALEAASKFIAAHPDDAQALYLRGKVLWRLGRKGEAMTDYSASMELDPEGPASIALEQAILVREFYNPDMMNP